MGLHKTLDDGKSRFLNSSYPHIEKKQNAEMFVRTSVITAQSTQVTSKLTPFTSSATPNKSRKIKKENFGEDETPVKTFPMKRRSLMRDIRWVDESSEEKNATKHPMEMRSRKSSKLKPYYDIEEYVDYGEDLKFLFEEEDQLPDFDIRPRRKSRKRKLLNLKLSSEATTELEIDSNSPTSENYDANIFSTSFAAENFSTEEIRPKESTLNLHLQNSNKNSTLSIRSAGTITTNDSSQNSGPKKLNFGQKNEKKDSAMKNTSSKRKTDEKLENVAEKRQKRTYTHRIESAASKTRNHVLKNGIKTLNNGNITPKLNYDNIKARRQLQNSSIFAEKLKICDSTSFRTRNSENSGKNYTVAKMMLRRRHSTPSLSLREQEIGEELTQKLLRTISTPAGKVVGEENPKNKIMKSDNTAHTWQDDESSCDSISDSEQFVDSPDSGFGSESSCSSVTPDGDSTSPLSFPSTKCDDSKSEIDCDVTKLRVSRTESNDSGIQSHNESSLLDHNEGSKISENGEEVGDRLILCQKSILEAQEREREEKKKQEEAMLREKYQCQWVGCPNPYESRCGADLHSHLQKCHAENYSCKWKGCRYFEIVSRKLSFLQRHIGEHSGEKPYKCILDGCDASFSSLCSRKRHVEAHYSEVSLPKARVGGENGGFSRYLLNSRRVKDKRKTLANRHDCMDGRTLSFIRNALIQNEVAMETDDDDDVVSEPRDIVFQSEILGQRTDASGSKLMLVRWKPNNMLPDEWVKESELKSEKRLLKSDLPWNTKESLKRLFFFGRKACTRKPSTKPSLLRSLF